MKVAFYVRVSTDQQTTENQLQALHEKAKAAGWEVVGIYDDNGISGAKGRDHRKQFDAMLKDAARGKFDIVAAWSVDRLGRSLQDLVAFLSELKALNVALYLHQQAVDTTTPAGRALFGMLSVFAEFERAIIQERVKAGMQRARKKGKHLGRPRKRDQIAAEVKRLSEAGNSNRKIGKELGVSEGTVRRILAA
jgi:DNA invertase Pin-like site-specific DNA recombinase